MTIMEPSSDSPPGPPGIPSPCCFLPVLRSGICANIGRRRSMEDAHVVLDDISPLTPCALFQCQPQAFYGVFDGHNGHSAAHHLKDVLLRNLVTDSNFPLEMNRAFVSAFLQTDRELEWQWREGGEEIDSGSTALAALILGRRMVIANAGDCRAVMSERGVAKDMTRDHRAASKTERARVLEAGGHVGLEDSLNGELGVTRALGDWHMEDLKRRTEADGVASTTGPLIAEPEVFESVLKEGDEFMVMACDGLWDAFPGSQEVISFARRRLRQHNDPSKCCEELVAEALLREAADNVTVVVICFSSTPPSDLCKRGEPMYGEASASCLTPTSPVMRRSISKEGLKSLQKLMASASACGLKGR